MKTQHAGLRGVRILSLAMLTMMCAVMSFAQEAKSVAVALSVKGMAEYSRTGGWSRLTMGTVLNSGDKVRTGDDGFCALIFTDDKSQVKIRPNTNIELSAQRNADYSLAKRVNMEIGELFTEVKQQKGSLQIATPTAVASVKGTEFWVIVAADGTTRNITLEGVVELLSLITGRQENVPAGRQGEVNPAGEIRVSDFDTNNVPQYLDDMQVDQIIIKFVDENGNEKTLIIQYKVSEE